jgi:hypothetical protein
VLLSAVVATGAAACSPPDPEPLPPDAFAFGVFGDAPYYAWERGPWRRVLADAADSELAFFVHVGDILWQPCSDDMYRQRRAELDGVPLPVIYTPGDNEWTDCHERRPGGYAPLERLASLRRIFFQEPETSLGASPIPLESQAADPDWSGFPENARWERGGVIFATLHMVGSTNAMDPFEGRTTEDDRAAENRTEAALAWLRGAFAAAREQDAWGVVLLAHADLGLTNTVEDYGHDRFVAALREEVTGFQGEVLYAHGDSHDFIVDHPLLGADGQVLANFTRVQTLGSPQVGWVRVVVDTAARHFSGFEPRWMRGYW